jgi:glycosyltransferase involved in cell wall biosynthesis
MKALLFWHDIYLPYSDYLIRAFAADSRIRELCVVGPDQHEAEVIYAGLKNNAPYPMHVSFKKVKTYFFRKKWTPIFEFKKCIAQFQPDCIIVIDEAFSINVMNAGIANYLAKNKASVLFYSFENIIQKPPLKFFMENISLKNFWVFIRKTARYFLADGLLQPFRSRLVHGGLACYRESVEVVYQFGWRPPIKIQWWGLDLQPFFKASPTLDSAANILGYVGRFIPEKGVLDLIDLIAYLGEGYQLVLVGGGSQEAEIKQKVEARNLSHKVRIIPPQARDELVNLYASFDVLILPSHTDYFWKEQYGRVLVEAMATGTPVMGSQSGAIPVVVGNPERCFPEGDVKKMATIVKAIIATSSGLLNNAPEKEALVSRAGLGDIHRFVNAFIELHLEIRQVNR